MVEIADSLGLRAVQLHGHETTSDVNYVAERVQTVIKAFPATSPLIARFDELDADLLLKGTQVDGVYSDDPRTNPKAKRLTELTTMEAIRKRLRVMDTTAFSLCMENKLSIVVFNLYRAGNIRRAVAGEAVGTLIRSR